MQEGFDLLEERVQKAVLRLRELQDSNEALRSQLQSAVARAERAEREATAGADKSIATGEAAGRVDDDAARELSALRHERQEIRVRLRKLLEILGRLD